VSEDAFLTHRRLLFTLAYEMLGSVADTEDVLQETWLRWSGTDIAQVRDPRAYLMRIATRQALNRLRALKRRRETYVGPWLPEPLLTAPDVAEDAELAENLSTALLCVLETLQPTERAVFVLREVFDVGYDEIAAAVGKSQAAVRQIAHRAREHVRARRPRTTVTTAENRGVLESFRSALQSGDLRGLFDVLAPDVVLFADGGGLKSTALRPVLGAERVLRYIAGGAGRAEARLTFETAAVNANPAIVVRMGGAIDSVVTYRLDGDRITGLYFVRNPEKLGRIETETPLTRR
jgi:RNA polymerase sigma-70 factor (TIGR02957 family)